MSGSFVFHGKWHRAMIMWLGMYKTFRDKQDGCIKVVMTP